MTLRQPGRLLMGASIGPKVVARARSELKDLNVILFEDLSTTLVDWIERNEIDVALAYDPEERPSLVRRVLLEEDLVLVTRRGEVSCNEITFLQTLDRDLILSPPRDSVRRVVERSALRISVSVTPAFEVQSVPAMTALS